MTYNRLPTIGELNELVKDRDDLLSKNRLLSQERDRRTNDFDRLLTRRDELMQQNHALQSDNHWLRTALDEQAGEGFVDWLTQTRTGATNMDWPTFRGARAALGKEVG